MNTYNGIRSFILILILVEKELSRANNIIALKNHQTKTELSCSKQNLKIIHIDCLG